MGRVPHTRGLKYSFELHLIQIMRKDFKSIRHSGR